MDPIHLPRREWFYLQPPSHLHGLGHTARVMVWACVLTRATEWFDTVVWAAACHDLRREEDGIDPEHGFRAGAWVRETLVGQESRPREIELVARACDWHVCPDRDSEWDHPTLWLLKDADGLDRVRLYDLDERFLRHEETRAWVGSARNLFGKTWDCQDPPTIWKVAQEMGLPVADLFTFPRFHPSGMPASPGKAR